MSRLKYILYPCSGVNSLGIPKNHVYEVKSRETGETVGYIARDNMEKVFKKGDCKVIESHTMCPFCYAFLMSAGEIAKVKMNGKELIIKIPQVEFKKD